MSASKTEFQYCYLETRHTQNGGQNIECLTWICTLEILRWIKLDLLHLAVNKTEMSAKGGSVTGSVGNEENLVENSTELSKIEMTVTADKEALQEESFNVDESETNGKANPHEEQSLEGEQVEDQVRTTFTASDLLFLRAYSYTLTYNTHMQL